MSPIFFTKTCARDWERCCYQMRAIRRFFPLATHVVTIEIDEWDKAVERQNDIGFVDRDLGELARPALLGPRTEVICVEVLMPEAMRIEDPYLRQQYCKLRAPVALGVDTIQLDSDMCPLPRQTRWVGELYVSWDSGPLSGARWHAPVASKAMRPAVENWYKAFKALAPAELDDARRPIEGGNRDFMRSQLGWCVPRNAARAFLAALGKDPITRILDLVRDGYRFSEYQMLGLWAFNEPRRAGIRFLLDHPDEQPWLMHFSSTEPLADEQRTLLRQAAGLE